ncbi:MAG: conjugal transfer protein [Bacteroidota bacterium]|nr:conjugal transfer protein [Bacteroidota bacterium]MEE3148382.1 conjugal transfer protein [Bacteroidota bacterium]MEE3226223.1 conjugal transfer protein [Bacteroidota bacterium]
MKLEYPLKFSMLIIIVLLLLPGRATAQGMPVYDNTNFVSLVKTLVESAKQTTQLLKTVEFLKQQKENLEQVNSVIRQLKAVREIGNNNSRLIKVMQNELRSILSSPYIKPEEVTRITNSFNQIVDNSLETMDFIDQILSSNFLKMSDGERAKILKEKEEESQEMVSEIDIKTKRYRDIISFRQMQDKINNRETQF